MRAFVRVLTQIRHSAHAPSGEEVLVQQHPCFFLESQVWSEKYLACAGYIFSGQVTCNDSTTLQDHIRNALHHSHGRTTHAYKGANHLATLENRATLVS